MCCADTAEGRPPSAGRGRRVSAGDPGTLRDSLKARRLSATAEAAQGIAVAREAIARSTAQWPSPQRPHMPTSLVPQTSVPEDGPLFEESSGRPCSARSAGSGVNFATAFSDSPAPVASGDGSVDGSALMDSTNSPRARQRGHEADEAHAIEGDHGFCADENAPHRDVGGMLVQRSHVGAQGRRRVGMGQADVELSKAAKEEMSVLQHVRLHCLSVCMRFTSDHVAVCWRYALILRPPSVCPLYSAVHSCIWSSSFLPGTAATCQSSPLAMDCLACWCPADRWRALHLVHDGRVSMCRTRECCCSARSTAHFRVTAQQLALPPLQTRPRLIRSMTPGRQTPRGMRCRPSCSAVPASATSPGLRHWTSRAYPI